MYKHFLPLKTGSVGRDIFDIAVRTFAATLFVLCGGPVTAYGCDDGEDYYEYIGSDYDPLTGCYTFYYDYGIWYPSTGTLESHGTDEVEDCVEFQEDPWEEEAEDYFNAGADPDQCDPNKFTARDGNAKRTIVDFKVLGSVGRGMQWRRHHNTVPRAGEMLFGVGGSWRHSYQYDLVELPALPTSSVSRLGFVYPTGLERVFTHDGTRYVADARFRETIKATANGWEVVSRSGTTVRFQAVTVEGKAKYLLVKMVDGFGAGTDFSYDSAGRLVKVTDASGHAISLKYSDVTHNRGVWHELGKMPAAVGDNHEEVIPEGKRKAARYVRLRAPRGSAIELQSIEAFRGGTRVNLRGILSADGSAAQSEPGAVIASRKTDSNLVVLDLGENAPALDAVRFVAAAGKAQQLAGLVIEALELVSAPRSVVTRVEGDGGVAVDYSYRTVADPATKHEFVVLSGTSYQDGSEAQYAYAFVRANTRPLLRTADDPRYLGKAVSIGYNYSDNLGAIVEEFNPKTNAVYARLTVDPADPGTRRVSYGDLKTLTFKYDPQNNYRIVSKTDSLGRATSYQYDGSGRLAGVDDNRGNRRQTIRDDGRVNQRTVNGKVLGAIGYNEKGRVVKTVARDGAVVEIERDRNERIVSIRKEGVRLQSFEYDPHGRVTAFIQPDGARHQYAYNERGLRTSWTNPRGEVTTYTHDQRGRIAAVKDAGGGIKSYDYNDRGLVTKITFPDGSIASKGYDKYGRLTHHGDRSGRTERYVYDDLGRRIETLDAMGGKTQYDYSDLPQGCSSCGLSERASTVTRPDGTVIRNLFDTEGRIIARTLAAGTPDQKTFTYSYDDHDNLLQVTGPDGTSVRHEYDVNRRRIASIDGDGRRTKWAFDPAGEIQEVTDAAGAAYRVVRADQGMTLHRPDGSKLSAVFDAVGNMTEFTDARGNHYRFTYDGRNRTGILYPDGSSESWRYNALGHMVQHTSRAGAKQQLEYDPMGRITRRETLGDPRSRTEFSYDAAGRLQVAKNATATVRRSYDSAGRLAAETVDLDDTIAASAPSTVQYEYGQNGHRAGMLYPSGGVAAFQYNRLDQLTDVKWNGAAVAHYDYNDAGARTRVQRANDVSTRIERTAGGQVTKIEHRKGQQPVGGQTLERDAGGRVLRVTHRDGTQASWERDTLGQVTKATVTNGSENVVERFSYDVSGNIVSHQASGADGGSVKRDYSWDLTNKSARGAIDEDAAGNRVALPGAAMRYNAQGQLVEVRSESETIQRHYDPFGRCVAETGSTTKVMVYDGWNVIEARAGDGSLTGQYLHSDVPDEIIAANISARLYFPLQDFTQSTSALTDATGALIAEFSYATFGKVTAKIAAGSEPAVQAFPFLFHGRNEVGRSGILDFRFRAYSVELGRFLQPDPIRFGGMDENLYRFSANDPLSNRDAFGLMTTSQALKAAGGIGGLTSVGDSLLEAAMGFCDEGQCVTRDQCLGCCQGLGAARAALLLAGYAAVAPSGLIFGPWGAAISALVATGNFAVQSYNLSNDVNGCKASCPN